MSFTEAYSMYLHKVIILWILWSISSLNCRSALPAVSTILPLEQVSWCGKRTSVAVLYRQPFKRLCSINQEYLLKVVVFRCSLMAWCFYSCQSVGWTGWALCCQVTIVVNCSEENLSSMVSSTTITTNQPIIVPQFSHIPTFLNLNHFLFKFFWHFMFLILCVGMFPPCI